MMKRISTAHVPDSPKSEPAAVFANPCKSFDGSTLKILVYIPNLIGYWRLFLVFYAFHELVTSHPRYFFALYLVIMALDFVDGLCARLLNQCSIFGAFLDVFVDIVARSLLWCHVTPQYAGWIIALECNQNHWKTISPEAPTLIAMIMKNGLHNPLGYCTCIGLNFLPLWMFVIQNMPTSVFASLTLGYFLLVFRLLAGMTELWFIFTHIQTMLKYDVTMQNKEMIFL